MLGLAAIGVALLKFVIPARKFGWACLLAGAYSMGGMTLADKILTPIPFQPNLVAYLLATAPLWLGFLTLLVCRAYHGQQPSEDGKFSLIFLFYVIALAAMLFGLCVLMDQLTISETSFQ